MSDLLYLDMNRVTGKKQTQAPLSRSRTGYGPKQPTSIMLQLDGVKWYRVYVMIWSNSGTAYIIDRGRKYIIQSGTTYEQIQVYPAPMSRRSRIKQRVGGDLDAILAKAARRGPPGDAYENPIQPNGLMLVGALAALTAGAFLIGKAVQAATAPPTTAPLFQQGGPDVYDV